MGYKWSYYNYYIFDEENFVIYNTKSGSVLAGETNLINEKDVHDNATKLEGQEFFGNLVANGFVIDETTDELEELKRLNYTCDEKTLHLTIVPTLDCNFACPYCYQNGLHEHYYMSEKVRNLTLDFIKNICEEYPIETVQLTWFGGEPTLSLEFIERFMADLTNLSRSTVKFKTTTSIVTNGYLLTPEVFQRLYRSYVRIFQITLDGAEYNHDSFRVLKTGQKTFHTIYKNLLDIKKMDKGYDFLIQVRANFFKDNLKSMEELADAFCEDFANEERFTISFRPILDFNGDFEKDVATKIEARQLEAYMLNYLQKKNISINEDNPMFTLLPMPVARWCKAGEKLRYVINYDGHIYRCDSALISSKYSIGKLESNGKVLIDKEQEMKWNSSPFIDVSSTCLKCKRLPICMGGCAKEILDYKKKPCHWTDSYIKDVMKKILLERRKRD